MKTIAIIIIIIIIIIFVTKENKPVTKEKFDTTTTSVMETNKFVPSYWYDYSKSDTRSKCFSCDQTSKYRHGTECFDCEKKGGRSIDPELNRVLTR
jgi:hypothetical protein